MEWIFWIGILSYLIIGAFCSKRYEDLRKKEFFNKARTFYYDIVMTQKEKDEILLKGLAIFFFWPLYLIIISIYHLLGKEVI